jgi:polyhydroxyalkanoate synthesis regulator phasin
MPPMRLLSKDFIGSMLSTQQTQPKPSEFVEEIVETMEISDDENEASPQDEKIARRKAIEKESLAMRGEIAKKKEAVTNIESRIKGLKLDLLDEFEF